jgi:hypothetical protein
MQWEMEACRLVGCDVKLIQAIVKCLHGFSPCLPCLWCYSSGASAPRPSSGDVRCLSTCKQTPANLALHVNAGNAGSELFTYILITFPRTTDSLLPTSQYHPHLLHSTSTQWRPTWPKAPWSTARPSGPSTTRLAPLSPASL